MLITTKKRFSLGKTILMIALPMTLLTGSLNSQMFWNHAAKFEGGANSYIACPNSLAINIIGSLTVEAWVNPQTNTGIRYIVFKGSAGAGYYLRINSNGTISLGTNGTNRITSTGTVPQGQWTHIAGSYNVSNNEFKIFINGAEDGSLISNNAPATSTDSLYIGKFGANSFTGMIDEVRLWTKAVSPVNIRRNRNTSLSLSSGQYVALMLSMPFQKTNSTGTVFVLSDFSLNPISSNIGYNRGVTGVNLGNAPSEYLSSNEALLFEGNFDSYAALPSNILNDITGAMTLEAWINVAGPSAVNQYIFHKRGGVGNGYRIFVNLLQKLSMSVNNSSFYEGSSTIQYNRWYHVAWVISASGASSLYVNGVLDAYFSSTGTPLTTSDSLYIGRGFNGRIDEARVFKFERSGAEINKHINVSIDAANSPAGTGFVFNFDGSAWASNNIQFFYLRGNTFFTAPASITGSASPLIRADNINFQDGYYRKINYRRIPQTGSTGFMTDDSINIPDNTVISDLNIYISLNHNEIDLLDIRLIGPAGQQVLLMDNFDLKGTTGNISTIFDDQADSSLVSGRYVHISPRIKPTSLINSVFNGLNSAGVWRLRINDAGGVSTGSLITWGMQLNNSPVIGIQNISEEVPERFSLGQNYPNPFNPVTNIKLHIPKTGFVSLKVYDVSGKESAVLVNENLTAGVYNVDFDASHLASGVYFYRLETEGFTNVKKMMLVK